ncbi:hypothetical protein B0H13DRAFT_1913653 [Mycena leptocephala]|nr:hypothetical protein B0H13DRAFT_1913653 [Mycena leptocephala]
MNFQTAIAAVQRCDGRGGCTVRTSKSKEAQFRHPNNSNERRAVNSQNTTAAVQRCDGRGSGRREGKIRGEKVIHRHLIFSARKPEIAAQAGGIGMNPGALPRPSAPPAPLHSASINAGDAILLPEALTAKGLQRLPPEKGRVASSLRCLIHSSPQPPVGQVVFFFSPGVGDCHSARLVLPTDVPWNRLVRSSQCPVARNSALVAISYMVSPKTSRVLRVFPKTPKDNMSWGKISYLASRKTPVLGKNVVFGVLAKTPKTPKQNMPQCALPVRDSGEITDNHSHLSRILPPMGICEADKFCVGSEGYEWSVVLY